MYKPFNRKELVDKTTSSFLLFQIIRESKQIFKTSYLLTNLFKIDGIFYSNIGSLMAGKTRYS